MADPAPRLWRRLSSLGPLAQPFPSGKMLDGSTAQLPSKLGSNGPPPADHQIKAYHVPTQGHAAADTQLVPLQHSSSINSPRGVVLTQLQPRRPPPPPPAQQQQLLEGDLIALLDDPADPVRGHSCSWAPTHPMPAPKQLLHLLPQQTLAHHYARLS